MPDQKETLTEEEVRQKVYDCIKHILTVTDDEIKPEADIISDLSADTLDAVELIMEVEERLDIQINDEESEKIHTVEDLVSTAFRMSR